MKNRVAYLLCLMMFSACTYATKNGAQAIEQKYKYEEPLLNYADTSAYKIIELQTTAESVMGFYDKIIITDSYVYVLNSEQFSVFIFDLGGKFINKINRRGDGPQEYLFLTDYCVYNDTIHVLDAQKQRVQKYNVNADYLGCDSLTGYKGMEFKRLNDAQYLFYVHSDGVTSDNSELLIVDKNGSEQGFLPRDSQDIAPVKIKLAQTQDGVYFIPALSDKLYLLKDNQCTQVFDYGIGDKMMPHYMEASKVPKGEYLYFFDLVACDNGVVMGSTALSFKPICVITNLKTGDIRTASGLSLLGSYKNYVISAVPYVKELAKGVTFDETQNAPIVLLNTDKIIY